MQLEARLRRTEYLKMVSFSKLFECEVERGLIRFTPSPGLSASFFRSFTLVNN